MRSSSIGKLLTNATLRYAAVRREIRELRKAAQKQANEMDKMLAKFKEAMHEKAVHDSEYVSMKEQFDDMRRQLADKDKYIVGIGRNTDKQHRTVDEVKSNLERTYLAKIKRSQEFISLARPASRERPRSQSTEPDDRISQQDGAGQDIGV
jgi:vacuolar-type H+-ATPase subunit I/STV1